jgi:acyl-CoA synthetase (AMP-forming)/AMP-acid ligase II
VYPVTSDDVLLAVLPFFHIYGLSIILNTGLRQGATVVTLPRFDLEGWLEGIERHRVTWLHVAPPMVVALVARQGASGHHLSSVRHAVSGAAPLDGEVARRAEAIIGCRIGQGYGMTEASPGTHFVPADQVDAVPAGSVGYLVPNTEARIVALDSAEETTNVGELWVRGPQVMAGYLDDPAATAAALDSDGWLRTGDVVRIEHGVFFVVDRVKELIKYKGFQVPPAELEALLLSHEAVADAAVVGVPDLGAGEIPKAFIVARSPLDTETLMAWVAERVAPYKRIRAVELVDELPKSPSGKILRRFLADRELERAEPG